MRALELGQGFLRNRDFLPGGDKPPEPLSANMRPRGQLLRFGGGNGPFVFRDEVEWNGRRWAIRVRRARVMGSDGRCAQDGGGESKEKVARPRHNKNENVVLSLTAHP